MATGYVRLWGNDNNTGLDTANAMRTINAALTAGHNPIDIQGWYNESLPSMTSKTLTTSGNTILFGYSQTWTVGNVVTLQNITIHGYSTLNTQRMILQFCHIYDCQTLTETDGRAYSDSVLRDIGTIIQVSANSHNTGCTFHNINSMSTRSDRDNNIYSNIAEFNPNNIGFGDTQFSLFINTAFKFTGGTGTDETVFTYPTGVDDVAKMQNLRDRMVVTYGGLASDYLFGCKYYTDSYNDIFVNADIGDFTLIPNSIAANMAYNGSYVGACGIGISTQFDGDFNTIVNISTNASTLGNVIDQTVNGTCITNIIDLGVVKNVYRIKNLGMLAYRNGMQFNSDDNMGPEISAGTDLEAEESYLVVNNTITYNSVTYNPWDTFKCITGTLSFTGTGQCQKVEQDLYNEKIQIQVSQTDPTVSGVATLTVYLHQDIEINEDVNGIPTFGNADASFVPGSAVNLDTRYIKELINIQANNLPAR